MTSQCPIANWQNKTKTLDAGLVTKQCIKCAVNDIEIYFAFQTEYPIGTKRQQSTRGEVPSLHHFTNVSGNWLLLFLFC